MDPPYFNYPYFYKKNLKEMCLFLKGKYAFGEFKNRNDFPIYINNLFEIPQPALTA